MKLTKIETVEDFWKIIPRDIPNNLEFRKELHSKLCDDESAKKLYLELCYQYPQIAFDTAFWTYNPKNKPFCRNLPFILRPQQIKVISDIKNAVDNGVDLLIEKSRDEGATELICKFYALYFSIIPETSFLVGSRKEIFVDQGTNINSYNTINARAIGSPKCLFHKILYTFATMPIWMRPRINKISMHIENQDNASVIDGEATNENFGAGDRRTAILLDEFGRVDHRLAQNIRDSVNDVADCIIYNSTHFYGKGHPFYKLRVSNKVKVILMPWYKNPTKITGLYKSPDLNIIKIHDKDYYKEKYPKAFCDKDVYRYSDLEKDLLIYYPESKINFIADGEDKWRSIWYDYQEKRRDSRDLAQNIDMNPAGSSDNFFDHQVCQRIRTERICKPKYTGEVEYKLNENGKVANVKFVDKGGRNRLLLWCDLERGRPNQFHNYIVTCDISLGTGASNSVCGIYDVNTHEKIGMWVSPNTPPEEFADQVVAICKWVGGTTKVPYLNWEANGPGGSFDKRIRFQGYDFVYRNRKDRLISRKRTKKHGWYSTNESKYDMLLDLRIALSEGLKDNPAYKSLIVYDESTVGEYESYMFYENGQLGLSECVDETTGARSAHGDRVITDGLAIVAMSDVRPAILSKIVTPPSNSFEHRYRAWKQEQELNKRKFRRHRY